MACDVSPVAMFSSHHAPDHVFFCVPCYVLCFSHVSDHVLCQFHRPLSMWRAVSVCLTTICTWYFACSSLNWELLCERLLSNRSVGPQQGITWLIEAWTVHLYKVERLFGVGLVPWSTGMWNVKTPAMPRGPTWGDDISWNLYRSCSPMCSQWM